jgi:hypothetical protein
MIKESVRTKTGCKIIKVSDEISIHPVENRKRK